MSQLGLDYAFTRSELKIHERMVLVALCYKLSDHQRNHTVVSSVGSMAALLEMSCTRIRSAIRGLEKGGYLSKRSTGGKTKEQYRFTINVINPYVEASELKAADRKTFYRIELFEQILLFYPVTTGRSEAWKAFVKLDPDEKMFFAISADMQKRLDGSKPSVKGMHLSTYFTRRLWELG